MWIARFLLFFLAQAIASGLFEGFQEFLLTRMAARQQGLFLWAKDQAAAQAAAAPAASSTSNGGGLASFFFGHPHAVVHSLDEESFLKQVAKGPSTGSGAPWLIHLYSPYDARATALNALLEEEVAPILYLSSAMTDDEGTAPSVVKLHIGKVDVTAHPHLAASLGWLEEVEEEEEHEGQHDGGATTLAPHRSLLKIVRASPSSSSSSSPLAVEDYHGRRTRQALLELAEHAATPASFFSSLYALPTPTRLRTPAELAAFAAEHPFVFVLAEPEHDHEQEVGTTDEMLRLAFVSTCEARMWRHCALVSRAALPASSSAPTGAFVAKLEPQSAGAEEDPSLERFLLDAAAFTCRPEALREWLQAQDYPLVAPMPLALEGPALDRLLRAGGRLVVARVRGGGAEGQEDKEGRALVERLQALAQDGEARAWLRAGRVRLGYVVDGAPRTQLPLGAAGESTGVGAVPSSALARLFVADGPTRGVYNVEGGPEALEGVVKGITEGRMIVPTFPLVRKGDPLGAYPHVAKLLAQVHVLAVAVAAAVAIGLVLGLVLLLSPRRWWVPEEKRTQEQQEQQAQEQEQEQEQPKAVTHQRLMGKFGSGEIGASITGAGALLESEM